MRPPAHADRHGCDWGAVRVALRCFRRGRCLRADVGCARATGMGRAAGSARRPKPGGMCFAFVSSASCWPELVAPLASETRERRRTVPAWHKNEKCGTRNHTLSCAESMAKPSRPAFILTQVVCALRKRVALAASGGRRTRGGTSARSCAAVLADSRALACVGQCGRGGDAIARIAQSKRSGCGSSFHSVFSVTFVQYGERFNELCEVSHGSCRT
jgi:hypothetical protein